MNVQIELIDNTSQRSYENDIEKFKASLVKFKEVVERSLIELCAKKFH